MTKVLLLRADASSPNLGVRVLKEGTESLVRRAFGADAVVHVQNFNGGDSGVSFNRTTILRDVGRRNGPVKSILRQYDLVIDVCGGDSFTDIYGFKRLALILYTQRASQRVVPTILGPQTIGPFRSAVTRRLAAASLRQMSLVLSRDQVSEREASQLGRPVDFNATDVVFALSVPDPSVRRGIVINVSGLLWNGNSHVNAVKYRASIRQLVDAWLAEGRQVTLFAHVLDNPSLDNDVHPIKALRSEYGDRVGVYIPGSLTDARRALARAELVVGSRMHACLNALSTGTPAIPWAYSRKFEPLLSDIGWSHTIDLRTEPEPALATLRLLRENPLDVLTRHAAEVREGTAERLDLVATALAGVGKAHE